MARLTEKVIFRWLKGMADEDCWWEVSQQKMRGRVNIMVNRYDWQIDQTRGINTTVTLLWRKRLYGGKARMLGFKIVQDKDWLYYIEFVKDFILKEWLNDNGRSICPVCGRINWLSDGTGTCITCRPVKCQVCGSEKAHYMNNWDTDMCKYTGLDTLRPICDKCHSDGYNTYMLMVDALRRQNEDLWVRRQDGRYKVKLTVRTIEGPVDTHVYAFKKKPTRKEVKEIIDSLDIGYVDVQVDVKDLGPLN